MDLKELRDQWSEVLNELERRDRMAWLVFFDARLADLNGNQLTLDFSDVSKFATGFDYSHRRESHRVALAESIQEICGVTLEILNP